MLYIIGEVCAKATHVLFLRKIERMQRIAQLKNMMLLSRKVDILHEKIS
jgi:hypothetical protein